MKIHIKRKKRNIKIWRKKHILKEKNIANQIKIITKCVNLFSIHNPECYNTDGKGLKFMCSNEKMYSIEDIAQWFLNKEPLTHKKLQKLCYYAQAWFLALKGKRLMDTQFEAWVHGPVSRELYNKYKGNGYKELFPESNRQLTISKGDEELLESVWQTYGSFSGNALEVLTHDEEPWRSARRGYADNENCENPISENAMAQYYKSIYIGGEA